MLAVTMRNRCWYISSKLMISEHYETHAPILILFTKDVTEEEINRVVKLNEMQLDGGPITDDGITYYPLKEVSND